MNSWGTVERIFRFPVKSMGGEELSEVSVDRNGLSGDREYGIRALDTDRVLSAKREASLMRFSARYAGETLEVLDPDGKRIDGESVVAVVGERLGRPVDLVRRSDTLDATLEGEPIEARPGEISTWKPPQGTFFDASSLHLISTATLQALRTLEPEADFDPLRFRPNFVIASDRLQDFEEQAWVGRQIGIGRDLIVDVTKPCSRCVMTTHAQGTLPRDRSILKTVARHNSNNAGIRAVVVETGTVRVGDELRFV